MAGYGPPAKRLRGRSVNLLENFKTAYDKGEVTPSEEIEFLGNLGRDYKGRGRVNLKDYWIDLLKAHTLFNSCALRARRIDRADGEWLKEAFEVQQVFWKRYQDKCEKRVGITFEQQQQITADLRKRLELIRAENEKELLEAGNTFVQFKDDDPGNLLSDGNRKVVTAFIKSMASLCKSCNSQMQELAKQVMRHAFDICGSGEKCPCAFEVLGLGSLAKGECTPYSDLEYLILVDNAMDTDYFVWLAVTSYFLIGNLQETTLPHLDIQELSQWYRDINPAGFQIDGIAEHSGNIPTGSGYPEQRNKFIKTLDDIIHDYQLVYNKPGDNSKKGDFSAMLINTASVFRYGDRDFQRELCERLADIKPTECRRKATREMFKSDIGKYNFRPDQSYDKIVSAKKQLYRYPSIMTHDLKIFLQTELELNTPKSNSFEVIESLSQNGQMSTSLCEGLQFALASAQFIRLDVYHHFKSQKDDLSLLASSGFITDTHHSPHYAPKKLVLAMFLYLIPVKNLLSEVVDSPASLTKSLILEPVKCAADVFYHSGQFDRFLECAKLMAPHGYESLPIEEKLMTLEALRRSGRFDEMLELIQKTDMTCVDEPGTGIFKLFEAHGDFELSRFNDAAKKYDEAHGRFGDEHVEKQAMCYRGLGLSRLKMDCLEDAESCFWKEHELFMSIREKHKNMVDVEVAGCLVNIALCQDRLGQYVSAEENFLRARDIMWKLRGPGTVHRETSMLYVNLGNLKMHTQDFSDARAFYEKALAIDKRLHADGFHADIARDLNNLGTSCAHLAEFRDAKRYFEESLKTLQRLHPGGIIADIALGYRNVATVALRLGDHGSAKRDFERSLEVYKKIHRESPHQDVADVHTSLGKLYCDMGDKENSISHYLKALSTIESLYATTLHPKLAEAYNNHAYTFLEQGDHKQALEYAHKALDIYEQIHKEEKPCPAEIANCYDTLGELHEKAGNRSKAAEHYSKSIQVYEEHSAARPSAGLAGTYVNLGKLYQSDETNTDLAQSLDLFKKAEKEYENVYRHSPDHKDLRAVRDLINALQSSQTDQAS